MNARTVLAVDVGGTSFKAALVSETGAMRLFPPMPTEGRLGEAAYERLHGYLRSCLDGVGDEAPCAIGLITPGMDETTGHVMFAANLGWRDFPLGPRLAARLGLPVAPGHDVRSAGLAEALLGAARGERDAAMIMIGTGIAAAFVCAGVPVSGARQMACELGHVPVYPEGEACACGQFGCLETYASASAIARRYRAAGGANSLTAAEIARRLESDPRAAEVWSQAVEALSIACATVTLMLDPAVIVLGGGLAEADGVLLDPLRAALTRRLAWRAPPALRRSTLGARGALLGAAIRAFQAQGVGVERLATVRADSQSG
ncbi:ROK family protein [Acidisoma sp. 7E03]